MSFSHLVLHAVFFGLVSLNFFPLISQAAPEASALKASEPEESAPSITVKASQFKKLNINEASADQIAEFLVGIGPKKAKAIVEYRGEQGPFKKLDDLLEVKGIGEATLQKNRAYMTID